MKRLGSAFLVVVSLLSIWFAPISVRAATEQKATITISPFLHEVRFSADEAKKDFRVEIANSTNQIQIFNLSVLDFGSLNDSGGVVFAGSDSSTLIKKYGLATWLHLEQTNLSVGPNQTAQIKATITNDQKMTPGGHYAAIIASIDRKERKIGNEININQQLSSLILATKVGGEKYDLRLNKISSDGSWMRLPKTVSLNFYNPGNVHVVPRGKVSLLSTNGKIIAQGIINTESSFVLPESSRTISVQLDQLNTNSIWPALHHIQVDYRYDGVDNYARKSMFLYYLNPPAVIIMVGVVGFVACLLYKIRVILARKNTSKT